jgi:UPF0271 protein
LYGHVHIDLNADVGESFGAYTIGSDAALMRSISSANVAAGFHAGDPTVLRATVRLARAHGVQVGAHPGFADLAGFGRRAMAVTAAGAEDLVLYQIAAVAGVAAAEGAHFQHVKPHGALYNLAARDRSLADAIARAVWSFDRALILFAPFGSALLDAGRERGLRTAVEAFADRGYLRDGSLVPRGGAAAVLTEGSEIVRRAIRMIRDHQVDTVDGATLDVAPDTLCIHSDTPGAGAMAARLREDLGAAGIMVAPLGVAE